ncbi:MAG: beta-galactosidase, partial [Coriobacteriaceae bacterium]|nr:beta-galactosidase [Coriobacteriaceae bacterium]
CLPLEDVSAIDWEAGAHAGAPTFSRYDFSMTAPAPTYVDLTGFGKGIVFVNGTNVGRFWEEGPIMSLYVPGGLLRAGENSIVVFETEGRLEDRISLRPGPVIRPIERKGVEET